MKRFCLLLFIFLYGPATVITAQKAHFFIDVSSASGDTSQKYAATFARLAANTIEEAFPCSITTTQSDINRKLEREKINQLTGKNIDGTMASFCEDLSANYFVYLNLVDYTEGKIMLVARCFNYKKVKCIADAGNLRVANNFQALSDGCRNILKILIDQMSMYELCPFKGPVNISVTSDIDSTQTEEYPVYCNGSDGINRNEYITRSHVESTWNLERKGINWTDGTLTFSKSEEHSTKEENSCYKCSASDREGGRISGTRRTYYIEGSGISHESIFNGKPQDDTRIILEFYDDNTYTLEVKGTSKAAEGEERQVAKAEGTCDNLPEQQKTVHRQITIPIRVIFGPYSGKSTDKILKQTDTRREKDPLTGEIFEYSIDFELSHD